MSHPLTRLEKIRRTVKWFLLPLAKVSKKIILPGFEGMPLYDVSVFFYRGVMKNSLNLRASAISFDFIMALAPTVLFFFTLIPLLPIPGLHNSVLETLHSALPENAYLAIQSTIEDIVSRSHGGFLSIGFLLSAYFASNGMISIMRAFNQSVLVDESRSNIKIRLMALFLVVIVSLIVILAAALQIMSYRLIDILSDNLAIPAVWFKIMFFLAKYLVLVFILFTVFSFIYYLAPARPGMYRFISAGSTLATVTSIIALEVFSYFINNFGHYNTIYGSLGTLIVILLLININSLILLVGFELNASIYKAKETLNGDH
jgi:membrane protein